MAVQQAQDPTQTDTPTPTPPPAIGSSDSDTPDRYTPQQKAAAIAGYRRGVSLGIVDPDDGLQRLKKIAAVHPATQKEELLDSLGPQQGPDPKPQAVPGQNPWMHNNQSGGWMQQQDDDQPGVNPPSGAAPRPLNRSPAAGFIGPKTQSQAIAAGQYQTPGIAQTRDNGTGQTTGSGRTLPSIDMSELDPLQQAALGFAGGGMQHQTTQSQGESNSQGTKSSAGITRQLVNPDIYRLKKILAMGGNVPQALDMSGQPQTDTSGQKDQKGNPLPPGAPIYDFGKTTYDPDDPYQKQQTNVDRLKQLLNMQQGITAQAPTMAGMNFKPLLAYADQLQQQDGHKSNLAESYTPPPTPQQNMMTNIGMQQKVLGDDNDLQKSLFENMRTAQPNTTLTDMLAASQLNKQDASSKEVDGNMQNKLAQILLGIDRIQQRGGINAQQTVNKDPILNTYSQRITGANKILNLMNAADDGKVASSQAMLGQLNAEIARLETGSQSPGLGAAEKTEMNSFEAQVQNIADTFNGAVTSTDLHDKFKQARAMVADLRKSYVDASQQRLQELSAGALQNQQGTFGAKIDALNKQYGQVPATKNKPRPVATDLPGAPPPAKGPIPVGTVQKSPKDGLMYKKAADGMWDLVK